MTLDVKALREAAEEAIAADKATDEPGAYMRAYRRADTAERAYLALLSPAAVLALLDRLERAEKVSKAAAKAADEWDASGDVTGPTFDALRAALDDEAPR